MIAIVCVSVAIAFVHAAPAQERTPIAAALQEILQQKPAGRTRTGAWQEVRRFYEGRSTTPAWMERKLDRAEEALTVIRRAFEHGLSAADYDEPQLTATLNQIKASRSAADTSDRMLADLDVGITAALLALGHDVAVGRTTPQRVDARWVARRAVPDLVASLSAARDGRLKVWLDDVRPAHPEYAALQKALANMQWLQKKDGGWPAAGKKALKPGAQGPDVELLRQRLRATGELAAEPANPPASAAPPPPLYDEALAQAVRVFQDHHGIKATGIADLATIAALNVPIGARLQQIATNLERWRWMPDDLGPRHVFVNIPAYGLVIREAGAPALSMRVVVGQADAQHRTPVFSSTMTTVVFSPYWNIPDTIADGELGPAVARDPAYLAKQGIEVMRITKDGSSTVDPDSIDWGNQDEIKELAFRQRPGVKNALGHVKFLLPNSFNVYLHDTPADHLFAKPGRALSHGCVRLEEPEAMAKYVLRDDPDWDDARIRDAMNAGTERAVKLKQPLPVHIAYFTAWTDGQGGLHLIKDIYRYDTIQAQLR